MSREKWLEERKNGIGGSDAAAVMGCSPYMSNLELWEIKTGKRRQEDISDKSYVKYGIKAEEHIRALFALDHPEIEVGYEEFKIIRSDKHPFIFATLDGSLINSSGEKGILEIKTTEIFRANQWADWNGGVPQNYYIQVLHQLLATGWEYAILKARIKHAKGITEREYLFLRKDRQEDLDILLAEEIKFWEYVKSKKRPPQLLPEI